MKWKWETSVAMLGFKTGNWDSVGRGRLRKVTGGVSHWVKELKF